jgi:hypothetical protein
LTADNKTPDPMIPGAEESLEPRPIVERDWFLQRLIHLANEGGLGFTITLNVGGLVVTGDVIGGKQYFEEFGKLFSQGIPADRADVRASVENSYKQVGEDVYSQQSEWWQVGYIHLKNASVWIGSHMTPPTLWRARISSVDSFMVGRLNNR